MPKSKQPVTLEKMALGVLLKCVVTCCEQLSAKGSLDELRQGVTVIKEKVCDRIPWHLLADFSSKFLKFFYREERSLNHLKAALEMIMDIEIVGLRCNGSILASLDILRDGYRFRKMKELNLSKLTSFPNKLSNVSLENFNINYLTTFVFPNYCNDHHLQIIGRKCPKLQILKISYSRDVTDEGLRALSPCSELRVVDAVECFGITHVGLSHLLSAHKKLQDFSYGYDVDFERPIDEAEPDVLFGLDWSIRCPFMRRFVFENNRNARPAVSLQQVVKKFPNLVYLQINCMNSEDLSALRFLNKLTGLEVNFVNGKCFGYSEIATTWQSIVQVLTHVGTNITTLSLSVSYQNFTWQQPELDFIFDACPNLEYLRFDRGVGVLVIPPFGKLKQLAPCLSRKSQSANTVEEPALRFGEMANLETLSLREFRVNFSTIKSIMLDHKKFPKLSVIETSCMPVSDVLELEQIARCNNLDFRIENDRQSDWVIDSKLRYSTSTYFDYDLYPLADDAKFHKRLTVLSSTR